MKNLLIPQTMFEVLVTPQKTNLWPLWTAQRTREWTNKTNRKLLSRNWNTPSWREEKGSLDPGRRAGLELRKLGKLRDSRGPCAVFNEQRRAAGENPGWSCLELCGAPEAQPWGLGRLMTQLWWTHSPCIHLLISNLNKFICSPRWNWMSRTVWGERLVFFILGGVCHWCPIWGE